MTTRWTRIAATVVTVAALNFLVLSGVAPADSLQVSVNVTTAGTMTLPEPIALNVAVGSTATTAIQVTEIKTNCPWNITVYKETSLKNGSKTIPSTQLKITSSSQLTPIEIPTIAAPAVVASGGKTGNVGTTATIVYHLQVSADEDAGAYETVNVFTLNTP